MKEGNVMFINPYLLICISFLIRRNKMLLAVRLMQTYIILIPITFPD